MNKFLILLLLVACSPFPLLPNTLRTPDTQARAAVRVDVQCVDNAFGEPVIWRDSSTASGVMISDRRVLTSAHVTTCPTIPIVHVTTSNGRRLKMVVEKEDLKLDLARLVMASGSRFDYNMAPPVMAMFEYEKGSVCVETAFPRRERKCGRTRTLSRVHIVTRPGNSGSGVYDEHGQIVGLVRGSIRLYDGQQLTRVAMITTRDWLEP